MSHDLRGSHANPGSCPHRPSTPQDLADPHFLGIRAVQALGLVIGFYALAVSISVGLLIAALALLGHGIWLSLFCLATALSILFAILPRFDRFSPPGTELTRNDQSTLFQRIDEVAAQVGTRAPDRVFLLPHATAYVTHRGGLMGLRGRRILGLGLPLLLGLNTTEMMSVLAHELGHFKRGDTLFGVWIYKTRQAIDRSIRQIHSRGFRRLFQAYARLFLKVTHAISRRQEFHADRVAAHGYGSNVCSSALQQVPAIDAAFHHYWDHEISPLLDAGIRPSICSGFLMFLGSATGKQVTRAASEAAANHRVPEEYDTHPTQAQRLEALACLPQKPVTGNQPALQWLENVNDLEHKWLAWLGYPSVAERDIVPWNHMGERFFLPFWMTQIQDRLEALGSWTLSQIPKRLQQLRHQQEFLGLNDMDEGSARYLLFRLFRAALAGALVKKGWTVQTFPGEHPAMEKDGERISLHEVMAPLLDDSDAGQELFCRLIARESLESMTLAQVVAGLSHRKLPTPPDHVVTTSTPPMLARINRTQFLLLAAGAVTFLFSPFLLGLVALREQDSWNLAVTIWMIGISLFSMLILLFQLGIRRRTGQIRLRSDGFTFNPRRGPLISLSYADIRVLKVKSSDDIRSYRLKGTCWKITIKGDGKHLRILDYTPVGARGTPHWTRWIEDRRARLIRRALDDGVVFSIDRWSLSTRGIRQRSGPEYSWSDLAEPMLLHPHILVWQHTRSKPVIQMPTNADHAGVFLQLASQLCRRDDVQDPRGKRLGSRNVGHPVGRVVVAILGLVFLAFCSEAFSHSLSAGFIVSGLVALCLFLFIQDLCKRLIVFSHGFALKGLFREVFTPFECIQTVVWARTRTSAYGLPGPQLLQARINTDNKSLSFAIKPKGGDDLLDHLEYRIHQTLAQKMSKIMSQDNCAEWVPGICLGWGGLVVNRKEKRREMHFVIRFDDEAFFARWEDDILILGSRTHHEETVHIHPQEENFGPGYLILQGILNAV